MTHLRRIIALTAALVTAPMAGLSQGSGLMQISQGTGIECLPDRELNLGGVAINLPMDAIASQLGQPQQRVRGPVGQDDFLDETLQYSGLNVYGFQGNVAEIEATSPAWRTPSGLQVGLSQTALFNALGGVPRNSGVFRDRAFYDVYFCAGGAAYDLGQFMRFYVDRSETVVSIAIFQDWP